MRGAKKKKRVGGTTLLTVQPASMGDTTVTELEGPLPVGLDKPGNARAKSHFLQDAARTVFKRRDTTKLGRGGSCRPEQQGPNSGRNGAAV